MNSRSLILAALLLAGCSGGGSPTATPTPTPSAAHEGGHEHPEGVVEMSSAQSEVAGVKVQAVANRPIQGGLRTTGTVTGDPDLEVQVSARVNGVIDALHARVGDWVRAGQPLATMDSAEVTSAQADYHRDLVEHELAQSNMQRKLQLARLGDRVRRPLEEARKELGQAKNELAAATAELTLARARFKRTQDLLGDGIASQQQVDEARAGVQVAEAKLAEANLDLSVAKAHEKRENRIASSGLLSDTEVWEARTAEARTREALHHSRDMLGVLGAAPGRGEHDSSVSVTTGLTGLVTQRPVARGERVEAGQMLFTILDISRLWIWIDLHEKDLAVVRVGMPVRIKVTAYPQRTFTARISYLAPELTPESRTVRARVEVDNTERLLKPNMFATVEILSGRSRAVLAVPASALTRVENQDVVYVNFESDHFERRSVSLGQREDDWVEVTRGLKPGEKIATEGTFALKSLDQKSATEEGHSHSH